MQSVGSHSRFVLMIPLPQPRGAKARTRRLQIPKAGLVWSSQAEAS